MEKNMDDTILSLKTQLSDSLSNEQSAKFSLELFHKTQNLLRASDSLSSVQFYLKNQDGWRMVSSHGVSGTEKSDQLDEKSTLYTKKLNISKVIAVGNNIKFVATSNGGKIKIIFSIFTFILLITINVFILIINRIKSIEHKVYENNLISIFNSLLNNESKSRSEVGVINIGWTKLLDRVQQMKIKAVRDETNARFAQLARQVAHDIRSPLTALQVITSKIQNTNPEEHELARDVFNRITTIAENLLNTTRRSTNIYDVTETKDISFGQITDEIFDIRNATEIIIKEKKLTINKGITISSDIDCTDNLYCRGIKSEFETMFSNILQNSIEAKTSDRDLSINVYLRDYNNNVELTIADDGCGIPAEHIGKMATNGFSYNKTNGNGIGLYNAKENLKKWGGSLSITSRENVGTQVVLIFSKG